MNGPPKLQYIQVQAAQLAYGADFFLKLPFKADFALIVAYVPNTDGQTFQGNVNPGADLGKYAVGIKPNDASAPIIVCTVTTGFVQGCVVIEAAEGQLDSLYIRPLTIAGSSASAIYGFTLLVGKNCDLGFYGAVFD